MMPHLTSRQISIELHIHHNTVADHLSQLGYKSYLDTWITRQLTERDETRRKYAASALLLFRKRDDWLKTIVTGDEKLCLYANIARKRWWVQSNSKSCLLYTSPSPRDGLLSRMPSSA